MSRPSELRAELAVMNVFRACSAKPGDALHMTEFRARWPDYGLRQTDLPMAVARLMLRGLIQREQDGRSDALILTVAGERWSSDQSAWIEYQLLVPRSERAGFLRDRAQGKPQAPRPLRRAWERRAFGTAG